MSIREYKIFIVGSLLRDAASLVSACSGSATSAVLADVHSFVSSSHLLALSLLIGIAIAKVSMVVWV